MCSRCEFQPAQDDLRLENHAARAESSIRLVPMSRSPQMARYSGLPSRFSSQTTASDSPWRIRRSHSSQVEILRVMDIPVGSGDAAAASTTWGAEYSRGLTSLLSDWQYSQTGITEPRLLEGSINYADRLFEIDALFDHSIGDPSRWRYRL